MGEHLNTPSIARLMEWKQSIIANEHIENRFEYEDDEKDVGDEANANDEKEQLLDDKTEPKKKREIDLEDQLPNDSTSDGYCFGWLKRKQKASCIIQYTV